MGSTSVRFFDFKLIKVKSFQARLLDFSNGIDGNAVDLDGAVTIWLVHAVETDCMY